MMLIIVLHLTLQVIIIASCLRLCKQMTLDVDQVHSVNSGNNSTSCQHPNKAAELTVGPLTVVVDRETVGF